MPLFGQRQYPDRSERPYVHGWDVWNVRVLPLHLLIVHLNGYPHHKLIRWFECMQHASDRPPLLPNSAEAPERAHVRIKERPKLWFAPILSPVTPLLHG
jgi:hypothetical protein